MANFICLDYMDYIMHVNQTYENFYRLHFCHFNGSEQAKCLIIFF